MPDLTVTTCLRVEQRGPARWLWLNRPEAGNALNLPLLRALTAALEDADADLAVRVVVITGTGGSFCVGGELPAQSPAGPLPHAYCKAFVDLDACISDIGKPLIAAVNGDATAGGLALAAGCDIAVAAAHAKMGTPEIRGGLFPLLALGVLRSEMPSKLAWRLFYSGELLSAEDALAFGLVTEVAGDAEHFDERIQYWISCIAGASATAIAAGRRTYVAMRKGTRSDHVELGGTALLSLLAQVGSWNQNYMSNSTEAMSGATIEED